jgi:hypothetical protein
VNKDKDDDTKSRDKNRTNHHTGSVAAEDDELTKWLIRLWARNEPPERLELWQMFGRNKAVRGEMIHHEDFRPGDKLDVEQANKLANEIMEAAQNDCDSLRRDSSYQLAVIDRNRRATPLVRRIGPISPVRSYAVMKIGDGDVEGGDDDENVSAHNVQLKYLQEGMSQLRWEKNRTDHVIGEMLVLQNNIIQKQQSVIDQFFDKLIVSFEKRQESEDRSLDRELAREKGRFMLNMWQDGVSTAKNLLPGFFGGTNGSSGAGNGATNGANGANGHNEKPSPERLLVTNFLTDVGRKPDLETSLFGNFEVQEQEDGSKKMVQTVPGIFKFEQFRLLIGVREGKLLDETLLELLPDSGHANRVTEDQVNKALAAGMPMGIGMAIQELFKLLKERRDGEEEHPAE